jgi:hypothetical protein
MAAGMVVVTAAMVVTLVVVRLLVVIIAAVALTLSVSSMGKWATPPSGVGTGWMTRTRMKILQQPWHLHNPTRLILIGIVTLAQLTILPVILNISSCVRSIMEETPCKSAMEQVCKSCILVLV